MTTVLCSWPLIVAMGLTAFVPVFSAVTGPHPSDWRQWRGPNASGVSEEVGLPDHWGPNSPEIQWRTPIPGKARSSPIVSGGHVFLTTAYADERTGRMVD